MAGIKDLDFDNMTQVEIDEVFRDAPFNNIRVLFSNDLREVLDATTPELNNQFCARQYELMREFCKLAAKSMLSLDWQVLLLESFHNFFEEFNIIVSKMDEQVQTDLTLLYSTRLAMNYYKTETPPNLTNNPMRALSLMVDLLPAEVAKNKPQWQKFQDVRITHEFILNTIH